MELKNIDIKEVKRDRYKIMGSWYKAGHYTIEAVRYIYDDGSDDIEYSVRADYNEEYLPEIYYNKRFGERRGRFEIQTTAYGAKSPAEIDAIIAGYKEAQEVCGLLEKLAEVQTATDTRSRLKEYIDKAEGRC